MNLTIALTLLLPAAAASLGCVGKRLRAAAVASDRGIALQTVIIMVVLLAIAGSVAAVLLTTGGESVDDLESQGFYSTTVTATNCTNIKIGTAWGRIAGSSPSVAGASKDDCEFDDPTVRKGECELYKTSNGKGHWVKNDGCILSL